MKIFYYLLAMIITTPFVDAQELGNPNCDSLYLVSSWWTNNVKIYDGCDGEYIRDLADPGTLKGPQSIFQDPNGDVIVVSESDHKLVKFDQETLSQATTVVSAGLMPNPITVVPKNSNHIYLGSYSDNSIIELNTQTWQQTRTVLPPNNHVRGIDIGMTLGPDGMLYVPGYDSDSILKVNPTNGNHSLAVKSGKNGLDRPRSLLFFNNDMWVTAYGNATVMRFNANGQFIDNVIPSIPGVTGMVKDGSNHILITSDTLNTVRRYNLNDLSFDTVVESRSGGLSGATFVYRLNKVQTLTEISGLQQAWMNGVGTIHNNEIVVNSFATTLGGAFGSDFDSDSIETILWGELTITFNSCHQAEMSYHSDLAVDGTAFGSGGYTVSRIAMTPNARNCQNIGFENTDNNHWMSGTFYDPVAHDGEGFNIDVLENNQAIVSWYTYLPQNQSSNQ